jgi:hypothetical protein
MPTIWFPGKRQSQLGDVTLPHAIEMAETEPLLASFRHAVRIAV